MTDPAPLIENHVRQSLIRDKALDLAGKYAHVFKLLPTDAEKPTEPGTWGTYLYDEQFRFWIDSSHPEAIQFFKNILDEERSIVMSTELTVKEENSMKGLFKANFKAIESVLPKHVPPERAIRVSLAAVKANPILFRQCNPLSLMNAIIEACILGLEVNTPLGLATIVRFGKEAVLIIEYKGKIQLSYNSGLIRNFSAHPVFDGDDFTYHYGLHPDLQHVPCNKKDPGQLKFAYAVANFKDGGFDFEVVDERIAMSAKDRSAAKNKKDAPWNTQDEPTMWVKTAIHRLWPRLPKSPVMQRAADLDARTEAGQGQQLTNILDADFTEISDPKELKTGKGGNGKDQKKAKTAEPENPPETTEKKTTWAGLSPETAKHLITTKGVVGDKMFAHAVATVSAKMGLKGANETIIDCDSVAKAINEECGSLMDKSMA